MNLTESGRWALWLSFPLAVILAVASLGGLLRPSTYAAETRMQAALSIGNDAGNLVVIVPVLTIAAILALRGSLAARLVWTGTLAYLVYDFLNYALAIHFNSMFLAYCGVPGLSFYALAGSLPALPTAEIARRFGPRTPVKTTAILLLTMSVVTILHWLRDIIPALLVGRVPQAVLDSGLSTEGVAALDLALGAPAFMIAAILLLRRRRLGFVLGPICADLPSPEQPGACPDGNSDGPARLRNGLRPVRYRLGDCNRRRRLAGVLIAVTKSGL